MLTVRQFSGETVMMVGGLRRPVRANALNLLAVGDRVSLAVFTLVVFTLTFVNVLIVLGTR